MAQVLTNTQLVERNARLGRWLTTGSLLVIIGPMVLLLPALFSGRADIPFEQTLLLYGALALGVVLSNVGGYYLNRWGLKQFEKVGDALKGTDKKYRLYNYLLPAPNVLLTPYGVTVLLVKNVDGLIAVDQKGWRTNVGILKLLRYFSAEQLGDPTKDLQKQIDTLRAWIQEHLGESFNAPMDGLIVFTNPKAELQITNVDLPIVELNRDADALKNALKRPKGAPLLSKTAYDQLYNLFEEEAEARRGEIERGFVVAGRRIF